MDLLKGRTTSEVWLLGTEHLARQRPREDFDVFLNIATPTVLSEHDATVLKLVDTFLVRRGGLSVETVAETIFPLQDYVREGTKGVFDIYPVRMAKIHHARTDRSWGSYAMRIVRQRDHKGEVFNPLKDLLKKIKDHGNYKACHELSPGRPFEDEIPIYDGALDRKPTYGRLPCLSHVSIKVDKGHVRLNATYRSHYYIQRLLGNLIGLGRLQFFLAHEAGLKVGPLTINSTYARLDTGSDNGQNCHWNTNEISTLLQNCRAVYTHELAPV
jgi:hypothetical protein